MPNRILREDILTNPRVASLGWAEEVFYRRLMSVVDDFGRYYADHGLLRAACYPRQLSKVSDSDIGKWLACLQKAALVRVYPAQDGEWYLEFVDFDQKARAKHSKFPDPPADAGTREHLHANDFKCSQAQADAPLGEGVFEGGDEDGDGGVGEGESRARAQPPPEKPRKRTRKPSTSPLPDGFGISDRVRRWAAEKGYSDLDLHFEHFVGKAKARGYTYADWDEAFMGAIRNNWAGIGQLPRGRQASVTEHNERAFDEWEKSFDDGRTLDA